MAVLRQKYCKFFGAIFCQFRKYAYLCIANEKQRLPNAKIAQLVEHDLAKVGVAGSSPVFRSKLCLILVISLHNVRMAELVDALL